MKKEIKYKLKLGNSKTTEHKTFIPVMYKVICFLVADYRYGKVIIDKEIEIIE